MIQEGTRDRESIFISGIDASITEKDIKEFFKGTVHADPTVNFHYFSVLSKPKVFVEVVLTKGDCSTSFEKLNNMKLKNCLIKLIPQSSMKALIITNIPTVISEKDLFEFLTKNFPNLKRIIVSDDPDNCGRTMNVAVAHFLDYESTYNALSKIKKSPIALYDYKIQATWKDPTYDILAELALETRCIYIKNISFSTNVERIKEIMLPFGKVTRIRKFMDRAFVEFESIASCKAAFESLKERRINGLVWAIHPAKKYDEERAREAQDKTLTFSRSCLSDGDKTLFTFIFRGTMPDLDPKIFYSAQKILDQTQQAIKNYTETFKLQLENMQNIKKLDQMQNNLHNDGFITNAENQNSSDDDDDASEGGISAQKALIKRNPLSVSGGNTKMPLEDFSKSNQKAKKNNQQSQILALNSLPAINNAVPAIQPNLSSGGVGNENNKKKKKNRKNKNKKNKPNGNPLAGNLQ